MDVIVGQGCGHGALTTQRGHASGESHNSCGRTFRLRNCGTTRPRGVACMDSNIFQHIPPVKVRLLGICPKMGYPGTP